MKFIVSRLSMGESGFIDSPPVPEATPLFIPYDPDPGWKACYTFWEIEINSLEELLKFMGKHGDILISDAVRPEDRTLILIADDYMS